MIKQILITEELGDDKKYIDEQTLIKHKKDDIEEDFEIISNEYIWNYVPSRHEDLKTNNTSVIYTCDMCPFKAKNLSVSLKKIPQKNKSLVLDNTNVENMKNRYGKCVTFVNIKQ